MLFHKCIYIYRCNSRAMNSLQEKHTDALNKSLPSLVRLSPRAFESLCCKKTSRGAICNLLICKWPGWFLLKCSSAHGSDMEIAKTRCFTDGSNSISSTEPRFNIPLNRQTNNCCFLNTTLAKLSEHGWSGKLCKSEPKDFLFHISSNGCVGQWALCRGVLSNGLQLLWCGIVWYCTVSSNGL